MLVSNLFENNPQENGMAVLKQLATAVRDRTDIDLEVGNELLPIKYYQANHLVSRWKALASSRQQNQALASFGDINWINDVLDAVDARMAAGAKAGSVEGGRDVDEGWKSNLAGAALIGMGAMGSNAANARDLSHYNTDYLQAAAQGGKSMVSADDAKAELQQRAQGKQQAVSAPNPGTKASAGYSKEYLQSVIDGTHPKPMISKDRAQALLQQYQTNETSTINGKTEGPGALRWKQTSMSYEAAVEKYGKDNVRKEGKNRAGQEVIAVHVPLGEQEMSEGNNDEYNDESGMAYNSLRTIHRATKGLANTIKDGDNLPEWCQKKISLAEDYLVTVWDYLQSEKGMAEGMFTKAPAIDPIIGKEINNIINRLWIRAKQTKDEYLLGTVQELFDILRNTGGTYSPPGSPGVRDVAEGLGYSQDPAQAKWYHEGSKAYKGGTTGNTIQDIAKKHGCPSEWIDAFHAGYQDQEGFSKDSVAEDEMSDFIAGGGKITQVPFRKPRKAERLGGSKHIGGPGDPSTSRFKGISANTQGKAVIGQTNRVSEAPGDKGSSREHLAMLQAEKKEHEQAQRAKQEKMDWNLKNYQAGNVRASDIKVEEASKTRTPTRDFLRKHPVPDSEMVKPVKNQDANASFKNMMGGSSNELTKNLKIKEQESTPGDEHTQRQKLIKYLAKHKGWDRSDLEHATTPELIQYYKECRQGMAEVSDPSGMMHAARHYNKSFIITAELAEGGTKKYRVHAQSERVAREKFSQHYNMAKVLNVEEEGVAEGNDQETTNRHIAYYNKLGQTPEINMSKDERYKHSAAGTDYAEFLRKNNVAIPAVEVMSTWGAGFLNAFKYGWKAPSREIDQAVMLIKQSKQGMAEGKDPTTDAAQEAYGFQRGEVKKNKDGSYVATNHAGSRKIFKSEKAAKAHADSGSQDMSEGSVNEVSVKALSSYGTEAIKSAAKYADLSGQYQEKAFDKYNKGGAAADRSWADQEKAEEYAAKAARRNAGADLAAVKLGKKFSKGMAEARSADDLKDELTSWKKEGPWKKTTTKDPRGKAPNLSDRARRETEKSFPTTKKV